MLNRRSKPFDKPSLKSMNSVLPTQVPHDGMDFKSNTLKMEKIWRGIRLQNAPLQEVISVLKIQAQSDSIRHVSNRPLGDISG